MQCRCYRGAKWRRLLREKQCFSDRKRSGGEGSSHACGKRSHFRSTIFRSISVQQSLINLKGGFLIMKVLVIGSGGREHAIAKQFSLAPSVEKVFVAPGNDGMRGDAEIVAIDALDFSALAAFAKEQAIDLTFVGPEQPLAAGIVDFFYAEGLTIFGPTKAAAQIEGSKSYAKEIMNKYNIPTAAQKHLQRQRQR